MADHTRVASNAKTPPARARRYFLFVHYNVKRGERRSERRRLTLEDSFYERLRKDLQYLVDIVERSRGETGSEWEGRAFVFVDVGWTHLLRTENITAARTLAIDLQQIKNEIMERLCLAECRRDTCRERRNQRVAPWPAPIQIITAADLIELLTIIDELEEPRPDDANRAKLSRHLVGDVDTLRYDASKPIEGMIRIANVGRNVPIFRFDDDVIFYGRRVYERCWTKEKKEDEAEDEKGDHKRLKTWTELKPEGILLADMKKVLDASGKASEEQRKQALREWRDDRISATRKSILRLCARYDRACANPKLHYFVFSGHYKSKGKAKLDDLLNGYATRVVQLAALPQNADDAKDRDKAEAARDPDKAKAPTATIRRRAARQFLNDLPEIGANPNGQVVSGGGLCLSDGAILDLPPYSNMRLNVLWIDDHLKYALHDELEHFDIHILEVGPAREADARFPQLRHATSPTYKDVRWHLREYMPRLLLGCVADAWLRQTREMKEKILPDVEPPFLPDDFEKARHSRKGKRPHVYAKAFLGAVPSRPSAKDAWDLHRALWNIAVDRLEEVCKLWNESVYEDTFLHLFLKGENHRRAKDFPDYINKHYATGLTGAVKNMTEMTGEKHPYAKQADNDDAAERLLCDESSSLDSLNLDDLSLADSVRVLIHDFVDYFETVGFWSSYVRAVRFLVNRSGQERELQWLFPPDESYGESIRIEPIVHVLEQLMDLHLDQQDFKALVCKGQRDNRPGGPKDQGQKSKELPLSQWRDLGPFSNEPHPQVFVDALAIKCFAEHHGCRADALWLIVRCYYCARAILVRGHGHTPGACENMKPDQIHKFALKYTYFFLRSENRRDGVELLERLEPKALQEKVDGATWQEELERVNQKLCKVKRAPVERRKPRRHAKTRESARSISQRQRAIPVRRNGGIGNSSRAVKATRSGSRKARRGTRRPRPAKKNR